VRQWLYNYPDSFFGTLKGNGYLCKGMEKPFAGRYCQFAPRACQNLTVIINRFILHTQTTIFKTIAKRFIWLIQVSRFPREYPRGFCFITVSLKNSKNTAFYLVALKWLPVHKNFGGLFGSSN
jgi:hypothetical protein